MKLKLDENGNVVVQDGKPVYAYEDSEGNEKEMVFDVVENLSRVKSLQSEAASHRHAKKEANEKLKAFEGIDPEKAREALQTVANLDDKKLVDAGEVDKLKEQLNGIYEKKQADLVTEHNTKAKELQDEITGHKATIRNLLITSEFSKSPWFVGDERKTYLTPDLAAKVFGDYFKVEGDAPNQRIVGYLNDEKILSDDPQRLGQPADFETAISKIIGAYPQKAAIMRNTQGGGGDFGNQNPGNGSTIILSKADAKDPRKYRAAKDQAAKTGASIQIQ